MMASSSCLRSGSHLGRLHCCLLQDGGKGWACLLQLAELEDSPTASGKRSDGCVMCQHGTEGHFTSHSWMQCPFQALRLCSISHLNPRSFLWAGGHAHISKKRKEKVQKARKALKTKTLFLPFPLKHLVNPGPSGQSRCIFMEICVSGKELLEKGRGFFNVIFFLFEK